MYLNQVGLLQLFDYKYADLIEKKIMSDTYKNNIDIMITAKCDRRI